MEDTYGRSTFGLSDRSSPAETIKTVGDFIDSWQVERQNGNVVDDPETVTDTALSLATLWGDAVCREFGWHWTCLEYKGQDLYSDCIDSGNCDSNFSQSARASHLGRYEPNKPVATNGRKLLPSRAHLFLV